MSSKKVIVAVIDALRVLLGVQAINHLLWPRVEPY